MITNIGVVDVYVSDQEKALDFYVNTLGFEKLADEKYADGRWIEVAPARDQQTTLALLKPPDTEHTGGRIGQDTNVAFETKDIRATYRDFERRGVRFDWEPVQRSSKNWDCRFFDQDNNRFLLVEYDPLGARGRHPMKPA